MREDDRQELVRFILRLSMYLPTQDRSNIISYVNGFEAGSRRKCTFTSQLSQRLAVAYQTAPQAMGWPGQVEQLARKTGKSWEETFRLVALEIVKPNGTEFQL